MHVAFLNRSFYPDTTATGQLLTELCVGLTKDFGCRVSVITGPPLIASGNGELIHEGIRVIRAHGTRFSKKHFAGRFSNYVSYFLSACYSALKLDRPDIVVALTDPPIIGLAAYLAARRFRVPFVMSYRDIFPEVARLLEDFQSETVNGVLQRINCFLAQRADRSVVLGESMRQRLLETKNAPEKRILIIPDWADCREIVPGPKENPFSIEHNLQDRFVVMHSGNIGLSQQLEIIVDAAEILRDEKQIQFVIVGEGVKKQSLMDDAKKRGLENILFLPYTPQERLSESFASADVFVVSLKSGMEGFIVPSKLYGILAAGRPFIAAVEEAGEPAIIGRQHECGFSVRPGDGEGLAEKILHLYKDESRRLQMGMNARQAAMAFDRPAQIRAYYELFCELKEFHAHPGN
jgi:glycosyltransferase involved in cell wall biosynthesis